MESHQMGGMGFESVSVRGDEQAHPICSSNANGIVEPINTTPESLLPLPPEAARTLICTLCVLDSYQDPQI